MVKLRPVMSFLSVDQKGKETIMKIEICWAHRRIRGWKTRKLPISVHIPREATYQLIMNFLTARGWKASHDNPPLNLILHQQTSLPVCSQKSDDLTSTGKDLKRTNFMCHTTLIIKLAQLLCCLPPAPAKAVKLHCMLDPLRSRRQIGTQLHRRKET